MTNFYFSPHKNIIEHTIANADETLASRHEILSAGTEVTFLDVGIMKFEPATAATKSVVISCGVHGNETAPIEIISALVDDLLAEEAKCAQRVLFILGNPWAIKAQQRFVDLNMNRLFCGEWQHADTSLKEVKRAAKLEAYVANFFAEEPVTVTERIHYDCHTAIRDSAREKFAVLPFREGTELSASQQSFLEAAGIGTLVKQTKPSPTFSSFSLTKKNALGFTLELGKVRPFGENNLGSYQAFNDSLRALVADDELPSAKTSLEEFYVCHDIERTSEQWQFFVADDVANFTEFQPGDLIWKDGDQEYRVGAQPECVVFPNANVPVGHRAGLMLRRS